MVSDAWASKGGEGDPPDEFVSMCMGRDAKVYRGVYRKMLFLAPQYREMTMARPDYGYLVFDDVTEAFSYVDGIVTATNVPAARENDRFHLTNLLERWRVTTPDQLKDKLDRVYSYDW